jgi:hypothetical protein
MPRTYSPDEVAAMRRAVYDMQPHGQGKPDPQLIEAQLQTYILAGTPPYALVQRADGIKRGRQMAAGYRFDVPHRTFMPDDHPKPAKPDDDTFSVDDRAYSAKDRRPLAARGAMRYEPPALPRRRQDG